MNKYRQGFLGFVFFLFFSVAVTADDAGDVENNIIGFYAALNQGDFDTVNNYLLPSGFTEFSSRGGLLIDISVEGLKKLFKSGLKVRVALQHIDVHVFDGVAYATFYRVGTIDRGGVNKPQRKTARVTSIWVKKDERWYLSHVHNSKMEARQ
jgi:ketosteroid isomerase-like protein